MKELNNGLDYESINIFCFCGIYSKGFPLLLREGRTIVGLKRIIIYGQAMDETHHI